MKRKKEEASRRTFLKPLAGGQSICQSHQCGVVNSSRVTRRCFQNNCTDDKSATHPVPAARAAQDVAKNH
ncbi:jg23948 [Pararge aegeria aegeria]|uniref:Jg23948 protein n=1 Tax=Pararge aegeria aegeria TaxID=348720 RepID=A0A8S4QJY2_9NEOP|nr:jg23948 [Pararge aegeria aegeria]